MSARRPDRAPAPTGGWRQLLLPVAGVALVLLVAAIVFLLGAPHLLDQSDHPPTQTSGIGPTIPAFSMTDHSGKVIDQGIFKDRWTLLFFGFTHCPDVCPTTMSTLAQTWKLLDAHAPEVADKAAVVLVSVDPDRDSPRVLAEYLGSFDPRFIGLHGDITVVKPLAGAVGVVFQHGAEHGGTTGHQPHDDGGHSASDDKHQPELMVDHTQAVLLVNPDGQVVGAFAPPLDPVDIARQLTAKVN